MPSAGYLVIVVLLIGLVTGQVIGLLIGQVVVLLIAKAIAPVIAQMLAQMIGPAIAQTIGLMLAQIAGLMVFLTIVPAIVPAIVLCQAGEESLLHGQKEQRWMRGGMRMEAWA